MSKKKKIWRRRNIVKTYVKKMRKNGFEAMRIVCLIDRIGFYCRGNKSRANPPSYHKNKNLLHDIKRRFPSLQFYLR